MAKSYLKVDDKRWKRLKRRLPEIAGAEVTVGIQSNAGAEQDGFPIAAYAAVQEFGLENNKGWGGPIPARPFLGSTFDDRRSAWSRGADIAISQALTGKQDFVTGLKKLGELSQRDVQETITTISSPPNSAATIEAKGSSNPLIDTGAMRQAIRYEVKL